MHPMNDCMMCIPPGWTMTFWNCNGWCQHTSPRPLHKLQTVTNMTARIITFTPHTEDISPVLRSLHWLPIHRRIDLNILLLVYLCLHDMTPQYVSDMLTTHVISCSLRLTKKTMTCADEQTQKWLPLISCCRAICVELIAIIC